MELSIYGAKWCPDTLFAEKALKEQGIPYSFISIESLDKFTVEKLTAANGGEDWAAPTFFSQGKYYACPTMDTDIFREVMAFYHIPLKDELL